MSKYENFIQDYPARLAKILDNQYESAKNQGLEVTLMLAIASSGLIVPFERLRDSKNGSAEHPTEDRKHYVGAAKKFDKTLGRPFLKSILWPRETGSWKRGKLKLETLKDYPSDPMGWKELEDVKEIPGHINLDSVLANIRDALAHGNIFIIPRGAGEIGQIIFLKENLKKNQDGVRERESYTFLICSPDDFKDFMNLWFQFLKDLKLPQDVISESINFDYTASEAAD
jgi:hypothetical protein